MFHVTILVVIKFKWPVQMYTHLKICEHRPRLPESKYEYRGDKLECQKCQKVCSHQSNVVRYVNSCKGIQERVLF